MSTNIKKAAHLRSFYDMAKLIKDPVERLAFYDALDAYRFDGIIPEELPPMAMLAFTGAKANIDADIERKAGGAPVGNKNASKTKTNKCEGECESCNNYEECIYEHKDCNYDSIENNSKTTRKQPENNLKTTLNNSKTNKDKDKDNNNDNEKEKDNVKDNAENPPNINANPNFTPLNNFISEKSLKIHASSLIKILEFLKQNSLNVDYLEYVYNLVCVKYPDYDNYSGVFLKAVLEWDNCLKDFKQLKEKAPQKQKEIIPKPPLCACGQKLSQEPGNKKSYACLSCNSWYEYDTKSKKWIKYP